MGSSGRIWAIVPAAGSSARFAEAGYSTPKPLLMVQKPGALEALPMVEHVLLSAPRRCRKMVVLPESCRNKLPPGGLAAEMLMFVPPTRGQADTLKLALQQMPDQDSVLVLDCDTVLHPEDVLETVDATEGLSSFSVAVEQNSTDINMSRVDSVPYPKRFVEKQMISEWGIVGARAFKQAGDLRKGIVRHMETAPPDREVFLADVMSTLTGQKYAHVIRHEWLDWGTPERLRKSGARIV